MTFSVRHRLTRRLTLDAQVVRTGWSGFDALRITQPVVATSAEKYGDTTSGAIGADYLVTRRGSCAPIAMQPRMPARRSRRRSPCAAR